MKFYSCVNSESEVKYLEILKTTTEQLIMGFGIPERYLSGGFPSEAERTRLYIRSFSRKFQNWMSRLWFW